MKHRFISLILVIAFALTQVEPCAPISVAKSRTVPLSSGTGAWISGLFPSETGNNSALRLGIIHNYRGRLNVPYSIPYGKVGSLRPRALEERDIKTLEVSAAGFLRYSRQIQEADEPKVAKAKFYLAAAKRLTSDLEKFMRCFEALISSNVAKQEDRIIVAEDFRNLNYFFGLLKGQLDDIGDENSLTAERVSSFERFLTSKDNIEYLDMLNNFIIYIRWRYGHVVDVPSVQEKLTSMHEAYYDFLFLWKHIGMAPSGCIDESVSLEAVVEEAIRETKPMYVNQKKVFSKIAFRNDCKGMVPCAYTEYLILMFRAIFANSAASFYSDSKGYRRGAISVRSFIEDGELIVEVKDNGRGIKKEVLEKIDLTGFSTKPFSAGYPLVFGSLGLGFGKVKAILKFHGGRIQEVVSRTQGGEQGYKLIFDKRGGKRTEPAGDVTLGTTTRFSLPQSRLGGSLLKRVCKDETLSAI